MRFKGSGSWELDDLVNDLHKEWSAHVGKKEDNFADVENVEELRAAEPKFQHLNQNSAASEPVLDPVSSVGTGVKQSPIVVQQEADHVASAAASSSKYD